MYIWNARVGEKQCWITLGCFFEQLEAGNRIEEPRERGRIGSKSTRSHRSSPLGESVGAGVEREVLGGWGAAGGLVAATKFT